MKKETIERYLLLEQTDELTAFQAYRLALARKSDPTVARIDLELRALTTPQAHNAVPPLPEATMNSILGEARTVQAEQEQRPAHTATHWKKLAAAVPALCLLIVVGTMWMSGNNKIEFSQSNAMDDATLLAWDDDLDTVFDSLSTTLAQVGLDMEEEPSLDELAEQLLELEGLNI